jgi:uncharacterized protein (DUF433 family)
MTTTSVLEPLIVPLTRDDTGTWRVSGTRIPLERVVESHKAGLSPESIVEHFDSLRLADVYFIIGYYLDHREAVEGYLKCQEEKAEEIRRLIEATQPPRPGMKEELLARKARAQKVDASVGH